MVTIRAATMQDAHAIARVHVQSWRSTYAGIVPATSLAALREADRARDWQQWLTLDVPIYVADREGEVVGFISGGPIREPIEGYDAELFTIYLLAAAQREGTGTKLLRTLASDLHSRGLQSLLAWVLASNVSSHFYQTTGASLVDTKTIAIDGIPLAAQAYGWPALNTLLL